ncbi:MAG: hypothetical protein R3F37_02200 [Candidatus Competibacteraceae bacterium]
MTLFDFRRDGAGNAAWRLVISNLLGLLLLIIVIGGGFYINQLRFGLVTTGMSDQVSWGFISPILFPGRSRGFGRAAGGAGLYFPSRRHQGCGAVGRGDGGGGGGDGHAVRDRRYTS